MAYTLSNLQDDIKNYTEVDSSVLSNTVLDTIIKNDTSVKVNTGKPISAYGYSYIDPANWSVPQRRAPICISKCPNNEPAPLLSKGAPVDVLEYTKVGSMLPKFEYNELYD